MKDKIVKPQNLDISSATRSHPGIIFDPASFRDPAGSVFKYEGRIFRTIAPHKEEAVRNFFADSISRTLFNEGILVESVLIEANQVIKGKNELSGLPSRFILEHKKIPVITYPYEWSFDMLKDAALTQLQLISQLLHRGYILKDGSAFNMQLQNGKMCFIDLLSIDKYIEGRPWYGYTQFCEEFLFPLMLNAYKGIDYQSLWRGSLQGIDLNTISQILGFSDIFKAGVFKHVWLQKILSFVEPEKASLRKEKIPLNIISKKILLNLFDSLIKVISSLHLQKKKSTWSDYQGNNTYSDETSALKRAFIKKYIEEYAPKTIVDLGSNTGEYSLFSGKHCELVVSTDIDSLCINKLYSTCKRQDVPNIIPLIVDWMNPSPDQGWNYNERTILPTRINPDGFLALAVIHHLCIGRNLTLDSFAQLLRNIAPQGVVEWVSRDDPMVVLLLKNREDIFVKYTWEQFTCSIEKYFKISYCQSVTNTRTLCILTKKSKT